MAVFAEKHGELFDRIQLIRERKSGFVRLEMNKKVIRDQLKLVTSNDQIDAMFEAIA